MAFHYPHVLFFYIPFALLLGLYAWSRYRRRKDLIALGDWRLVSQLIPQNALKRRRTKDKIALIALFLLIFAAAGPQFGSRMKEVRQRGVQVFIAMDTSKSMLAEDVPPSRLDRAKRSLGLLIKKLQGNQIGIIAFAKRAVIQCPLTIDNDAARMFLEILDENAVPEQGTAIGDAIRLALKSFPKDNKAGRAIVLLTDGEDHRSDPMGAAKEAREAGVVIFTIGIGTTKGEVIKNRDDQGKVVEFLKYKGEMVLSRLDDALLTKMAETTSGQYYRASSTDKEIDEIADILNGLEKKEFATKLYERLQERYQVFLLIVLLLLLLEFFYAETPGQMRRVRSEWNRVRSGLAKRIPKVAGVSALILVFSVTSLFADIRTHVRTGNKLLKKGDIAGARQQFEDARIDDPDAAFLPYNIATTYYKEGNTEEAKRNYEQALQMTNDPSLKSMIAYNLGHLLFNTNHAAEAIDKFKECLKYNPKDMDAKYNIEYIKAGNKPKSPPQQGGKGKQQGDNKKDDQKQDQNSQEKSDQSQQQQEQKKGELSKEDADRILQMMREQESEKMKNAQQMKAGSNQNKKDDANAIENW